MSRLYGRLPKKAQGVCQPLNPYLAGVPAPIAGVTVRKRTVFVRLHQKEIPKSGSLNSQIIRIVSDVDDLTIFVSCVQRVENIITFIRNDGGGYFYSR